LSTVTDKLFSALLYVRVDIQANADSLFRLLLKRFVKASTKFVIYAKKKSAVIIDGESIALRFV